VRRRRAKDRMQLNAEINVVSLIDVMMLLLVIFMLTAPMMTTGLDIKLPEADAKPIESTTGITVSIDQAGTIFLNGTRMSLDGFTSAIRSIAKRSKDKSCKLEMDKSVTWEIQAPVLTAINQAGLDVGFVLIPKSDVPK
jgi:biopolymer transport protein TolR